MAASKGLVVRGNYIIIPFSQEDSIKRVAGITEFLMKKGYNIISSTEKSPDLEDVFLNIVGTDAQEGNGITTSKWFWMKLFDIAWKEISLIKSQRIALLLIVLYPLLVVGLMGSAFTGLDVSKMKENKVGVVNELSFYPNFSEKFTSLKELSIIEYPSAEALTNAIKKKEVVYIPNSLLLKKEITVKK